MELKIIYWDDLVKDYIILIKNSLKNYFKHFNIDVNVRSMDGEFSEFIDEIEKNEYSLIISDLHDEKIELKDPIGRISLIINAISERPLTPILIFSEFIKNTNFEEFSAKYKIEAIGKNELSNAGAFNEKLEKCLDKFFPSLKLDSLNSSASSLNLNFIKDFRTLAAVNSIGIDTLKKILIKIVGDKSLIDSKNIQLKALTPGYSGAYIIAIFYNNISTILKVSTNSYSLICEYNKFIEHSAKLPFLFKSRYKAIDIHDNSVNGWHFLEIEHIENSSTMFEFISSKDNVLLLEKVLSRFFQYMKPFYSSTKKEPATRRDNFIFEDFDNVRINFLVSAYSRIEALINYNFPDFKIEVITSLLINNNYENINFTDSEVNLIISHGDLHTDNILVVDENPVLIDYANINYRHFSLDVARLIVDLFIRGLDNEEVKYYDINDIKSQLDLFELLIDFKTLPLSQSNKNAINVINWIIGNRYSIMNPNFFNDNEFLLGISCELLKVGYKSLIFPPNKRTIALICAYKIIIKVNKAMKK